MTNASNLYAARDRHILAMIRAELRDYKPDLSRATGDFDSTRYPTPTGNRPGGYTPSAHTHPWSDITSTPTTLAGYGITDAQPLDSDLTAIAALSTTSYGRGFLTQLDAAAARSYIGAGTGSGTVTSVNITAPAAGITASGGPVTTSGSITLALANDLAALEGLGGTGLAARTGADAWAQRTITGTASRISITNGSGAAGNPTIDIDSSYAGQASITTVGTIGTGTWQGAVVGSTYGGTGVNNAGRTLTISANSGTLAFSAASSTLTIPATGTAALGTGANTQVAYWSGTNTLTSDSGLIYDSTNKRLGVNVTPTVPLHVMSNVGAEQYFDGYFDSGNVAMRFRRSKGSSASPTTIGANQTMGQFIGEGYASTAADFLRGSQISFVVDGTPTNAGDIPGGIDFYVHTAGTANDAVALAMRILNSKTVLINKSSGLTGAGDLDVGGVIQGGSYIALTEVTAPSAPAANGMRLFVRDSGASKTQLCAIFNTGAVQVIASEP